MLKKYNELRELYKANREVLNKEADGIKLMNYVFDTKNYLVGLIEENKIEGYKQDFIYNNHKLEGVHIVELCDEYGINIPTRTRGALLKNGIYMNSESGQGKKKPTQKMFELVEYIQCELKDRYHNYVQEDIDRTTDTLNKQIDTVMEIFNKVL